MNETDRVLRPLREAEDAIDRLDTYESPAVLTEALRATWHAVERTLRTLLRSDSTAPDDIRLTAMSPDVMDTATLLLELRRRDLIPLGLAGRVHELQQVAARAGDGGVRAADADVALDVVHRLEAEVRRREIAAKPAASGESGTASGTGAEPAGSAPAARQRDPAAAATGGPWRSWPPEQRRPLTLVLTVVVLLVMAAAAVALLSQSSDLEQGISAFGDGRHDAAEQHFRAALQNDPGNTTAQLYLARILRRDGRREEAARLLQAAAAAAPEDAGVRRELGYLFLDLDRPGSAATQFRRSVELDAADPLNWAGVVHALRQAGDTSGAAEWLRRAPAAAREMLRLP